MKKMKKYFFTILLLALANASVYAQVTIQPNVPAAGIIQKNQLWNVLIVNSSNNAFFGCRLNLLLRDRATGQEIFTATTAEFIIDAGVKQLNINTLNPIQYNYLSGVANNNLQGLIATGSYTACYSLTSKLLNIAEECIPFDTEPLSPPMLIFPADSSVLDIAPTQLSWTAPTPADMFDRLQYEILITEVQDGQKANEAIQQNLPFYNDGNLFNNVLNYPTSAQAFEKNKWYAWQIIARDDKTYAGKSEVWVFKIQSENKIDNNNESFAEVKPFYTAKKYYFTKTINFSFNNPYKIQELKYTVTEVASKIKLKHLPKVEMGQGLNQVSLDVSKMRGLEKNKEYVIEIENVGTSIHYLNFIIKD
jgi:hypothetical protein